MLFINQGEKKQRIQALKLFDKSKNAIKEVSTELIDTDAVYRYPDMIFIDENGDMYIIEFQTGKIISDDLYRFTTYVAITSQKFKKNVYLVIIYTEEVDTNINHEKGSLKLLPIVYSFKHIDGCKILKRLKNKISNNKKLTENELDELEFLPLFKSKLEPGEVLFQTTKLTNELVGLTQEEIDHIKTGQTLLVNWLFKDSNDKNKVMDVIKMNTSIFHEIYNDGEEKGIEKGISQEKLATARKMLKLDYSIEDIVKVTGLSKNQIENL